MIRRAPGRGRRGRRGAARARWARRWSRPSSSDTDDIAATTASCATSSLALCRAELAVYKVPRIVEFRAEIPRSPLGKILRKYLVYGAAPHG